MGRMVLTYHMTRLEHWSRTGADLLGLEADLSLLLAHGVALRSLDALLDAGCSSGVAITFDDGTRIDAEAHRHPRLGQLPSALEVLRRYAPQLPGWHASSFVIASPTARTAIADSLAADYGTDLLHQRWWSTATREGLLRLENHSWDHNHPLLVHSAQRDNLRGSFANIETEAEADAEVAQASDYIEAVAGRRPCYFAYPFGESSRFLREDYLPRRGRELGLSAAFSTEPRAISPQDSAWHLPRFVSGRDWCDDVGLEALLTRWL